MAEKCRSAKVELSRFNQQRSRSLGGKSQRISILATDEKGESEIGATGRAGNEKGKVPVPYLHGSAQRASLGLPCAGRKHRNPRGGRQRCERHRVQPCAPGESVEFGTTWCSLRSRIRSSSCANEYDSDRLATTFQRILFRNLPMDI